MVEGHQCHRVAHAHRKVLVGRKFLARSPNDRFTDGAKAIHQQPLTRIEVHGKNLFYFFGPEQAPVVMRIHFGMSGAFRTMALPGKEPRETTRLELINREEGVVAHLSAMTVQHGDLAFYEQEAAKLGPDPLREDADPELLWERMKGSKKPVGLFLMDQTSVAGIGNIYRAEILFKAGVHPEQPGNTITREAFERIWEHSVVLLQRGFKSGSILTVDPEEAAVLGKPWTRRYVYNHKTCGRCGAFIRTWDMAARTVYACETCQPLIAGTELPGGRAKALAAARPAQQFKSHCAPEPPEHLRPSLLTVAELKAKLAVLQLPTTGKKGALVMRLEAALAEPAEDDPARAAAMATLSAGLEDPPVAEGPATAEDAMEPPSPAAVHPGTERLGEIASAEAAALEKAQAGEGRNVEHVALEDDLTAQLAAEPTARKRVRAAVAQPGRTTFADRAGLRADFQEKLDSMAMPYQGIHAIAAKDRTFRMRRVLEAQQELEQAWDLVASFAEEDARRKQGTLPGALPLHQGSGSMHAADDPYWRKYLQAAAHFIRATVLCDGYVYTNSAFGFLFEMAITDVCNFIAASAPASLRPPVSAEAAMAFGACLKAMQVKEDSKEQGAEPQAPLRSEDTAEFARLQAQLEQLTERKRQWLRKVVDVTQFTTDLNSNALRLNEALMEYDLPARTLLEFLHLIALRITPAAPSTQRHHIQQMIELCPQNANAWRNQPRGLLLGGATGHAISKTQVKRFMDQARRYDAVLKKYELDVPMDGDAQQAKAVQSMYATYLAGQAGAEGRNAADTPLGL
ncbi:hypothetical protein WJX72_010568 [[Myrmecia] bisecta]|uniref:DNA-(apurinic or apyrimidinic site) lyase n=1 Tax=[Myrmecia] bisecta TaxID=41462 RepID=A0AAW1PYQ7_9CHLO